MRGGGCGGTLPLQGGWLADPAALLGNGICSARPGRAYLGLDSCDPRARQLKPAWARVKGPSFTHDCKNGARNVGQPQGPLRTAPLFFQSSALHPRMLALLSAWAPGLCVQSDFLAISQLVFFFSFTHSDIPRFFVVITFSHLNTHT